MKPSDTLRRRVALRTLAVSPALVLHAGLNAAVFAFNATSSGTWTADDSAAPLVTLEIAHPTVAAAGFSFSGLAAEETVDTSLGLILLLSGSFTFTDAGGAELFGTYDGSAAPTGNPGEFLGAASFQFTGGTGLFAGATGGGTIGAEVQFTGPLDGVSTWEWNGEISLVPEPEQYGLGIAGVLLGWACRRHRASGRGRPEQG